MAVLISGLLAFFPAPSSAQWVADGVLLSPYGAYKPSICSDGAGGAFVAWNGVHPSSTYYTALVQRVTQGGQIPANWDPGGVVLHPGFGLSQFYPTCLSDGQGGAIVVWNEQQPSPDATWGVYAQRIGPTGTLLWGTAGVPLRTGTPEGYGINIASDGVGGVIVVWAEGAIGNRDIRSQRVDATGSVSWTAGGMPICTAPGDQGYPFLTSDGSGGAFVIWDDPRSGVRRIYAQHIGPDGGPVPGWPVDGMPVSSVASQQNMGSALVDGAGGVIVTWIDLRNEQSIYGNTDLYAQRLAADGSVAAGWNPGGVPVCTAPQAQGDPAMVPDGQGGAIVVWNDLRSGAFPNHGPANVFAQRITAAGSVAAGWPSDGFALSTNPSERTVLAGGTPVASDGDSGAVVTWTDNGAGGDIYAQRVTGAGAIAAGWPRDGVQMCGNSANQYSSVIANDQRGGAIVAWVDARTPPNTVGVYAQRVRLADGAVGDQGEWSELTPAGTPPSGRLWHTAIYDPVRDRMVVFGGENDGTGMLYGDVLELSPSGSLAWTQLSPAGTPPSARKGHTAIYDPVRDRMVVFGGYDGSSRNDVWTLSLSGSPAWTQLSPAGTPPSARVASTAIYDPVRDRMVVFGGDDGTTTLYGDVWTLSLGENPEWIQLSPGGHSPPEGHIGAAGMYDPLRDRMVVFAGCTRYGFLGGSCTNDVLALSLSASPDWTVLNPTGGTPPSIRTNHTAIYDPVRDRMVVFAGVGGGNLLNDVWALSLAGSPAWTELAPSGTPPSPRAYHTAIYDPLRDRMVAFGGYDPADRNDTWALTWGTPASPPAAPSNLQATTTGCGQTVALTWTDNSNDESSFETQVQVDNTGPWSDVASQPANSQAWTSGVLTPGHSYGYRVRACSGTTCSAWSATAAITITAFEITSASFDKSRYTTGDVATLNVTLKSNGAAGAVQVAPVLKPHFGQSIALEAQSIPLTQCAPTIATFTWSVPSVTGQALVDLSVSADGGTYGVRTLSVPNITVMNELSAATIQAAEQQLQACGTTTAQTCHDTPENLAVALIPILGTGYGVKGAEGEGCLAVNYWRQGRHTQSVVMWAVTAADAVGAVGSAVRDFACLTGVLCGPATVAKAVDELVPGAMTGIVTCLTGLFDAPPAGDAQMMRRETATAVDSLMNWLPDSLQRAFADAGDTLADLALSSGHVSLRIESDSCFTTADSVGNEGVVVLRAGSQALEFAAIKVGAARLFGPQNNATSASMIRLIADSSNECKFVVFHRRETGEVVKLEYAPFLMDSGGSASLAVAQDSTVFALRLDRNGDEAIDYILYPGGAVVSVPGHTGTPNSVRSSISLLGNVPNPFFGSTTIHFHVTGTPSDGRLVVHDIAGRTVTSRNLGSLAGGNHAVVWDGRNSAGDKVAAGIYFYQLVYQGGASISRRLVVLQ